MEKQKQCVSVRLSNSDIKKIKRIADRLQVSDSDVMRFAIKGTLSKLSPLSDAKLSGAQLLPVFIEYWIEVARYFDFDTDRLDTVINTNTNNENLVERDDIELIAMHNVFPDYLKIRLENILGSEVSEKEVIPKLRDYMYSKYGKNIQQVT